MIKYLFSFIIILLSFSVKTQDLTYKLELDSIQIPGLGGLQSYSFGQADGKWLIVGGRLDGLHRRQPWATFDIAGHNNQLIVVDPIEKRKWSVDLKSLDSSLQEHLSSTNIQFYQKHGKLYLVGGYGFSALKNDHITFPFICIVDVPKIITAIVNGTEIGSAIVQIRDEQFAVTGGQLQMIDNTIYLVGGHRFDGRYNPMDNPTFVQTYTNEVRRFTITFHDGIPIIEHLSPLKDDEEMHRRDFNVLPNISENGSEGILAFSGVFQRDINIPFLNAVSIGKDKLSAVPNFAQYYNHYHCASLSMYSASTNQNHYLFFGGIAHYYDSLGMLVQDNDVPFTSQVSQVVANTSDLAEYSLPLRMPGYLGAASEFIINPQIPLYNNEVIQFDKLEGERVLLGYIFGGITSSAANIFWANTGVESNASNMIYPVYLIKNGAANTKLNTQSTNGFQLQACTDPIEKEITFNFTLDKISSVRIEILKNGKRLKSKKWNDLSVGKQHKIVKFRKQKAGDIYQMSFSVDHHTIKQCLVVR